MNNNYYLVYWYNYKHKSTIFPIYLEMKKRGLNVDGILYKPENETKEDVDKFKRADYIITSSNCGLPYYRLKKTNKIIWTWHGSGNVLTSEGRDLSNCKYVRNHKLNLMIGSLDYKYFAERGHTLEIIGYPKVDNVEDLSFNFPYEKTVFYVEQAHWQGKKGLKPLYNRMVEKLVELSNKYKFNLLVRRYVLSDLSFDKFNSDHIKITTEEDSTAPYHKYTDIFIGDIKGSNLYESLAFNNPVLYHRIVKRGHFGIPNLFKNPFGLLTNTHTLEKNLVRTLEKPNEFESQRLEFRDKLYYKLDGKASERAVNYILQHTK